MHVEVMAGGQENKKRHLADSTFRPTVWIRYLIVEISHGDRALTAKPARISLVFDSLEAYSANHGKNNC
jgi:hypothetical protein